MFKRAKVVMLPTDKKAENCLIERFNRLSFHKGYFTQEYLQYNQAKAFHLYFFSDDKIENSDPFLSDERNSITENNGKPIFKLEKCEKISNDWIFAEGRPDEGLNPNWCKKIITTTDKSLAYLLEPHKDEYGDMRYNKFKELPQPSQSFIEKFIEEYNKGNVISEVLVEYEELNQEERRKQADGVNFYSIYKPKVNPKDNTITIKKVKDSWNREEVVTLVLKMQHDFTRYKEGFHFVPNMREIAKWSYNWIEENL